MSSSPGIPPIEPLLPERAVEQAFHAVVVAARERMREISGADVAADPWTAQILRQTLKERSAHLLPLESAAFFGAYVYDGARRYIGYDGIYDRERGPLVVNWKAPEGDRYMGATAALPRGLVARRAFTFKRHDIVATHDEVFDDLATASAVALTGEPVFTDELLAELERSRDGAMRDIVRTMSRQQYELVSAPLEQTLVIQGGPGTGKTAIALHRASVWKYRSPNIDASDVLIIGPSRVFLEFISGVLPSLGDATGEGGVRQVTIEELGPRVDITRSDAAQVRAMKGEARMMWLLDGAIRARIKARSSRNLVATGVTGTMRAPIHGVNSVVAEAMGTVGREPYDRSRAGLKSALRAHAMEWIQSAHDSEMEENRRLPPGQQRQQSNFVRASVDEGSIDAIVDDVLPPLAPVRLLRELFASRRRLTAAAGDRFTQEEIELLLRDEEAVENGFSEADVPLLDYLDRRLRGTSDLVKMVVVDEAQDLSPMQLHMVGSRCRSGAITLVGDIAQGTSPWARDSWDAVIQDVTRRNQRPVGWRSSVQDLTIGYRVPAPALELAVRVLPAAAPEVTAPIAIRPGREPRLIDAEGPITADLIAAEIGYQRREGHSVGVIAFDDLRGDLAKLLDERGVDWSDGSESLTHDVVVIDPVSAKGLEFDSVIVVEPAAIAESDPRGERLLYIALTRCTQALTVIYSRPYPLLGIGSTLRGSDDGPFAGADPAFGGAAEAIAASIRSTVLPARWSELLHRVGALLGIDRRIDD